MSKLLSLSITFALSLSLVTAQEEPLPTQAGFLQIVNLVSIKKPTFIEVAGLAVSGGEPVAAGESSGVVALIPNEYRFTISNEAAKPKSTGGDVTIENGKNVVIVFFDEEKEFRDGSKEIKLRHTILKELSGEPKARLSLVSLSNRGSIPAMVNGEGVTLNGRQAYPREVMLDDEIKIRVEGKTLGEIDIEKPIHYIAFLYDDPETGELGLSVIQEEKLEYQSPLPDEEDDEE